MTDVIVNPYAKKKRKRPIEHKNDHCSSSPLSKVKAAINDKDEICQKNGKRTYDSNSNGSSPLSAKASALIISAADKAGMEGIDRSKIDAIILRESGNSLFMQQQRRRDGKVNERVRQLQKQLEDASPRDYRTTEDLDEMLRSYQQRQAIRATCVVVDMVGFYRIDRMENITVVM